jgi:hypothetical protein
VFYTIVLANAIWSLKGPKGPIIFVLVIFLYQNFFVTLQKMQAYSILSWVVTIRLTTSQLPTLQDTPPITANDILQAVDF